MKNQALFSSKDKSTKFKCLLLQFLFGALRVNFYQRQHHKIKFHLALVMESDMYHTLYHRTL